MNHYAEFFAANLRRVRDERGLTLKQVADRSGVDLGVISKFERGIRDPALTRHMIPLALALGVDLLTLFEAPSENSAREPAAEPADPMAKLIQAVARKHKAEFYEAVADVLRHHF